MIAVLNLALNCIIASRFLHCELKPLTGGYTARGNTTIQEIFMRITAALLLSLLCSATMAQTLTGFKLDAPQVSVGQPVKATIDFEVASSVFCGVRISWGDGLTEALKIDKPNKVPYSLSHTYSKAGDFVVTVKPEKVTTHLRCNGNDQQGSIKVIAAAAAAPVAPASAASGLKATAAKTCPAGWALNAKSVNKKTQAFTCTAKPGTAVPDKKLECSGDTGYFENAKKGVLGCRV
jgi:hypothetical protein